VVFARDKALLKELNSSYPGRASNSPIIDLFITLLEMGKTGWLNLLKERKATYAEFSQTLREFAEKYGEDAIILKDNKISMALTIRGYLSDDANTAKATEELRILSLQSLTRQQTVIRNSEEFCSKKESPVQRWCAKIRKGRWCVGF
jgi:O-phospho-L-seryl-tRNASec:L-selenocysteinyl-tRNA synthase